MVIMEAHVPYVVFPQLPADGPDPDDVLHPTGDGQRVVEARIAHYCRLRETVGLTLPLAPSTARAARRYAIVGRVAGPIKVVMNVIAAGFVVQAVSVDHSIWHTNAPFFLGMAALAEGLRHDVRPSVGVRVVPRGLQLSGLSKQFVLATEALNPPGTVVVQLGPAVEPA
jgi:hypothetical protein